MLLNKQLKQTIVQRAGFALTTVVATVASIGFASAQTFTIMSVASGQVLDVPGLSTTPGTQIQQWPANGGKNQQWTIRRVSNLYEIKSVNSGQVLDAPNSSTQPFTTIQQWPPNGGANQMWWFNQTPSSTGYEIISADVETKPGVFLPTNLALDVPGLSNTLGNKIQQWEENDSPHQQWLFHSPAKIAVNTSADTVTITGGGFPPNTEVCAAFRGIPGASCAMVDSNGLLTTVNSLNTTHLLTGAPYNSEVSSRTVVSVEDRNGNVLAIGSVPGAFVGPIR